MIHILDPRNQSIGRTLWRHDPVEAVNVCIGVAAHNSAHLVAFRRSSGLFQIVKLRCEPLPPRPVRMEALQRYVKQTLGAVSNYAT